MTSSDETAIACERPVGSKRRTSARGFIDASGPVARDATYLLALVCGCVWVYLLARSRLVNGTVGFDFEGTLWDPANAILEGRSPYPVPLVSEVDVGNPAIYPPLSMIFVAPLTLLPWSAGVAVWSGLLIGALALALYLLGVRDLRCYLFAAISLPVAAGVIWGNLTLLLVPLVAGAWRWRERPLVGGALLGVAIAAKLFVWPLAFWLLGTRRYRAAAMSAATAGAGLLIPWAMIGFDGLRSYPDLLAVADDVYAAHSYSVATMASALGVASANAGAVAVAAGIILAGLAYLIGREGRDETAVSVAILAAVLGSPIVWEYNYALLFVPIAIARPRFSPLWVLPVVFHLTHRLPRPQLTASDLELGGAACCRPEGVPLSSWIFNHAPSGLWPAAGHAALAVVIVALVVLLVRRDEGIDHAARVSS